MVVATDLSNRSHQSISFSNVASGLATLAATGSAAIVTAVFAPDVLTAWGWRIPFLVGGILGLVGLVLRGRADETSEFEVQARFDRCQCQRHGRTNEPS